MGQPCYSDEPLAGSTQPSRRRDTTHYQMQVEDKILAPLLLKLDQTSDYKRRREAILA